MQLVYNILFDCYLVVNKDDYLSESTAGTDVDGTRKLRQ